MRIAVTLAASFVLLSLAGAPVRAEALRSPFPGPLPDAALPVKTLADCPDMPAPPTALPTVSRYRQDDPTRSVEDAAQSAAYDAAVAPLRRYQREVVDGISDFVDRPKKKAGDAACAVVWMKEWAGQQALVALPSDQGQFNRDQALAGLALAWLQLGQASIEDPDARPRVEAWFRALAEKARFHYDVEAGRVSRANNHRYFAALGVAAAAVSLNDRPLFDWGVATLKSAACQAEPDGALPLEMGRGERAREYQIFATGPLVMLAELAERNGVDAYGVCDGALRRVIGFTLTAIDDPAAVEKRAGVKQRGRGLVELKGHMVAWLAPYLSRFPDRGWQDRVGALRSLKSTSLGGDLKALYRADADDRAEGDGRP